MPAAPLSQAAEIGSEHETPATVDEGHLALMGVGVYEDYHSGGYVDNGSYIEHDVHHIAGDPSHDARLGVPPIGPRKG